MLNLIAAALGRTGGGSYDHITADWTDLVLAYPTSSAESTKTTTFSVGSSRSLKLTYTKGDMYYKIGTGSYTYIASGDSFSVSTGNSVTLQVQVGGDGFPNNTKTVTVYDNTGAYTVDTFTVTTSGWPAL